MEESRMYFFTIYQLTGIQAGIQCGHAALEYAHKYKNDPEYVNFIENCKTWVILNGGTTNSNYGELGSLNEISNELIEKGIKHACFYEPDLNNALTSICFIVDLSTYSFKPIKPISTYNMGELKDEFIDYTGSDKNFFLWELIYNKPLARN